MTETKCTIIGAAIAIVLIIVSIIGYVVLSTSIYKRYDYVVVDGTTYSTEEIEYAGRSRSGGYDIFLTDGTRIYSENVTWHK